MTTTSIAPAHTGDQRHPAEAGNATVREVIESLINQRLSVEADRMCGATRGSRTDRRRNRRNGFRVRSVDTIHGTLTIRVPKFREGSFPVDFLNATIDEFVGDTLSNLVTACYTKGISTRDMASVAGTMGVKRMSKSTASRIAAPVLDAKSLDFRNRPLVNGPYRFVSVDAMVVKVREDGHVVFTHILIATGINRYGKREVLGCDIGSAENGSGWLDFFRDLVSRGMTGVSLVTADAHVGLIQSAAAVLPGVSVQRCRKHYIGNLLNRVPKSGHPYVIACVQTIFTQPTAQMVAEQFDRIVDVLRMTYPSAAKHLESARDDLLVFTKYPRELWSKIWSSNPIERVNKEVRRRCRKIGVFPDRESVMRLVGTMLADTSMTWATGRRYVSTDVLDQCAIPVTSSLRATTPSMTRDLALVTA